MTMTNGSSLKDKVDSDGDEDKTGSVDMSSNFKI